MKPGPLNYADRMRGTMSWMLFVAGGACFLIAVGVLLIIWLGHWRIGTEPQRISIMGWIALGGMFGGFTAMVGFAIGGPVGHLKASVDRDGAELEANGKDDSPSASVSMTATVKP